MTDTRECKASSASLQPLTQIPALDGVRGVAILLVLLHTFDVMQAPLVGARYLLEWVLNVGWVGVQLFFALSGFLITRILLATQANENYYQSFFARRALRILPLYYLTLSLGLLGTMWFADAASGEQRDHWIYLWLFVVNWSEPLGYGVALFPHFWSLAVEEQFYLAWPWVVRAVSPHRLLQLCGVVMLAALLARVAILAADYGPQAAYMFTVCRMDALAAGAASAVLLTPRYSVWLRSNLPKVALLIIALLLVGAVVTRGYARTGYWSQTLGYSILALGCALLVLLTAWPNDRLGNHWLVAGAQRAFAFAPLRACGRVSYGMYVFGAVLHMQCGMRLLQMLDSEYVASMWLPLVYAAVGIAVTYGLAAASFELFEKRVLALKRFFAPKRASNEAHAAI